MDKEGTSKEVILELHPGEEGVSHAKSIQVRGLRRQELSMYNT